MHPDQATEPLVDVALKLGLPFAVVPCCVFAADNPGRRLRDGREPNTYELFLDYLQEKDEGIRRGKLGFRGRDTVLYHRPGNAKGNDKKR